jgi:hypothetical protein
MKRTLYIAFGMLALRLLLRQRSTDLLPRLRNAGF